MKIEDFLFYLVDFLPFFLVIISIGWIYIEYNEYKSPKSDPVYAKIEWNRTISVSLMLIWLAILLFLYEDDESKHKTVDFLLHLF